MGKKFKELLGHILGSILSGLVGLKKPRDHGVPYSITEEFVSAYRMHSLLPETLVLRDITSSTSEDKHPPILHEYFPFSLLTLYLQILGTSMMDIFLPFFFPPFMGFLHLVAKFIVFFGDIGTNVLGAKNHVCKGRIKITELEIKLERTLFII